MAGFSFADEPVTMRPTNKQKMAANMPTVQSHDTEVSLAVINTKIEALLASDAELKTTLKGMIETQTQIRETQSSHKTVLRIVAAVAVACAGLVGWSYTTVHDLYSIDAQFDKRLTVIETRANNPIVQPNNNHGKSENDN